MESFYLDRNRKIKWKHQINHKRPKKFEPFLLPIFGFCPWVKLLGIVTTLGALFYFIIFWEASVEPKWGEMMETFEVMMCSEKPPLTHTAPSKEAGHYVLRINISAFRWYVDENQEVSCCYSSVSHSTNMSSEELKTNFKFTNCVLFENEVELSKEEEFVFVKCVVKKAEKVEKDNEAAVVYSNMHAVVPFKSKVQQKLNGKKQSETTPRSVIMISYDSISKLSFLRTLPMTADYLRNNGFSFFEKYNTIVNNASVNIMAILTGLNSKALDRCFPSNHQMDLCPFIWKDLSDNGYITAFIEDEPNIPPNAFESGYFVNPPTDYYFHPYLLATHKFLPIKQLDCLGFCTGSETTADRIMKYTMDLATTFRNNSFFAFIRLKNYINCKSKTKLHSRIVDWHFVKFFRNLQNSGTFNTTFIVFFSNQNNLEFIMKKYEGWFEETLPFLNILVPASFKENHPNELQTFLKNSNELVSPHDLHVTLKDFLKIPRKRNDENMACPTCKSLFSDRLSGRSCTDAGIPDSYCIRKQYLDMPIYDPIIERAGKYITKLVRSNLREHLKVCAQVHFQRVVKASVFIPRVYSPYHGQDDYLIHVEMSPNNTLFEAVVDHNHVKSNTKDEFNLVRSIIRINNNIKPRDCVYDQELKVYCICLQ